MATKSKSRLTNVAAPVGVDDWQTEDDLRTLMRAEEIEKDPKRFAKVKAMAKKKMMDMAAVATDKE